MFGSHRGQAPVSPKVFQYSVMIGRMRNSVNAKRRATPQAAVHPACKTKSTTDYTDYTDKEVTNVQATDWLFTLINLPVTENSWDLFIRVIRVIRGSFF